MPSVRVRRQATYSSLTDDRPRSRRPTDASLSEGVPSRVGTLRNGSDGQNPQLSSFVYHSVRRNSLSYRTGASAPLSEQGASTGRTRSSRRSPALREIFHGRDVDVVANTQSLSVNAAIDAAHDEEDQREKGGYRDGDFEQEEHHDDDVVDHLDVIDPQVGAVTALTNAANAIVFPPVSVFDRRPTVVLPTNSSQLDATSIHPMSVHEDELDAHVQHVLTKRQKFKRIMRGVWAFIKTPQGIIVAIYGFLVAFWGAAIVLFLLKWINLHNKERQDFWIELTCQIVNTLFCLTGLGLAPWRILDTYRIYKIWRYKRITRKRRERQGLPKLLDSDDLPDPQYDPNYVHVLTDKEQLALHYQQVKFMASQTWYRPHGTETHRAFPIHYALAICSLNVGNSIFQAMLAGCMWSMDLHQRPAWTTGCLIPCAFSCGIISAVLIWRGGEMTKRTKRVEELLRAALAARENQHKNALPETILEDPEKEVHTSQNVLEEEGAFCASPATSLASV